MYAVLIEIRCDDNNLPHGFRGNFMRKVQLEIIIEVTS